MVSLRDSIRAPTPPKKPNSKYHGYITIAAEEHIFFTLTNYNKAITSNKAQLWLQAMDDEYTAFITNSTFNLVPLPPRQKAISTRWLYKVKQHANRSIKRYKAHWITHSFTQIHRVDYDDKFHASHLSKELPLTHATN